MPARVVAGVFAALVLCAALPALAQHSPYAGQETRAIKSLPQSEIDDLLAGRGMGLAKAAELNGFPGPMHVLELSDRLALSDDQTRATRAIMDRMRADAQRLGRDLIEAERHLDMRFAHRHIDPASLAAATARIGELQGQLRAVHLAAHLDMKALLTPQQTEGYVSARGYGQGQDHHSGHQGSGPSHSHQHKH
jgi:Spy/CpxP family protein refolding chaperone